MGLAATARTGLTVPTRSRLHGDPGSAMSTPAEQPPNPPPSGARWTLRRLTVGAAGLLRWLALGFTSGILAGLACWAFLTALDRATEIRIDTPTLVWLLPVAGLAIGGSYHLFGGRAGEGNALLLDEIHQPARWVPRRMAPMVGIGTVVSHLFGASVGREGTALQMSGSLSDWLARLLGLRAEDRRILLTAALGGGFGAVFGVPLAGAVFGLEVQRVAWHRRPDGSDGLAEPRGRRFSKANDRDAGPGNSSRDDRSAVAPQGGTGSSGQPDVGSGVWHGDRRAKWWLPIGWRFAGSGDTSRPELFAGFRDRTWLPRVLATFTASIVGVIRMVWTSKGTRSTRNDQPSISIAPASPEGPSGVV